jgi:hypothetical protein
LQARNGLDQDCCKKGLPVRADWVFASQRVFVV